MWASRALCPLDDTFVVPRTAGLCFTQTEILGQMVLEDVLKYPASFSIFMDAGFLLLARALPEQKGQEQFEEAISRIRQ